MKYTCHVAAITFNYLSIGGISSAINVWPSTYTHLVANDATLPPMAVSNGEYSEDFSSYLNGMPYPNVGDQPELRGALFNSSQFNDVLYPRDFLKNVLNTDVEYLYVKGNLSHPNATGTVAEDTVIYATTPASVLANRQALRDLGLASTPAQARAQEKSYGGRGVSLQRSGLVHGARDGPSGGAVLPSSAPGCMLSTYQTLPSGTFSGRHQTILKPLQVISTSHRYTYLALLNNITYNEEPVQVAIKSFPRMDCSGPRGKQCIKNGEEPSRQILLAPLLRGLKHSTELSDSQSDRDCIFLMYPYTRFGTVEETYKDHYEIKTRYNQYVADIEETFLGGKPYNDEDFVAAARTLAQPPPRTIALQEANGRVQAMVEGIALGLDEMHQRGIAHRDMDLGNVVLFPDGGIDVIDGVNVTQVVPKLIDFGSSIPISQARNIPMPFFIQMAAGVPGGKFNTFPPDVTLLNSVVEWIQDIEILEANERFQRLLESKMTNDQYNQRLPRNVSLLQKYRKSPLQEQARDLVSNATFTQDPRKIDSWSLGLLTFRLLTGETLIPMASLNDIARGDTIIDSMEYKILTGSVEAPVEECPVDLPTGDLSSGALSQWVLRGTARKVSDDSTRIPCEKKRTGIRGVLTYLSAGVNFRHRRNRFADDGSVSGVKNKHIDQDFSDITDEAIAFMEGLLEVDPAKRVSVADALKSPWLTKAPEFALSVRSTWVEYVPEVPLDWLVEKE